jgi:DNA-binding IclR family transcriptional regulator
MTVLASDEHPAPRRRRSRKPLRAYTTMRTVQALERLAFQPLSAPELATALQIHVRTARELLQRLEVEQYATPGGGRRRRYHATQRLATLGRQALAHTAWPRQAAPLVAELTVRSGETAGLWIPCYADVVCLLRADPGGALPEPILGALAPAHASAPGKVLLAHRPAWRQSILAGPLQRHTARTLTDPRDLAAELDRVHRHSYATDHGEHDDDVKAIAVPVIVDDEAVAALAIQLAAADAHTTELATLVAHATRVAIELARTLTDHH